MRAKRAVACLGLSVMMGVINPAVADDALDQLFANEPDSTPQATPSPAPTPTPASIQLPEAPAPDPARPKRAIEEIVVTAQKTEQSLQDVPISVSALGRAQIQDAAIVEAQELMQYTPNVKYAQAASFLPTINIRGFGSPPLGRNLEPSVGLSIDDVFYGRSTFIADAIFDIDRVEVLRGPQGTLFGKNTIAGVLNFTTAQPDFDNQGFVALARGSLSETRVEGALDMGLIDQLLAARVSFRARDRKLGMYNTLRDETATSDDLSGRIKLRWLASDTLTVDLGALLARTRTTGNAFELQQASQRSLLRYQQVDPDADAEAFNGHNSFNEANHSSRDARSLWLKLEQFVGALGPINDLNINLILADAQIETPYLLDSDFSPVDSQSVASQGPETYHQRSFELRSAFSSAGLFGFGQHMDWIVGIYGMQSAADVTQNVHVNFNGVIDSLIAGGTAPGSRIPQVPEALGVVLESLGLPRDISDIPGPFNLIPEAVAVEILDNATLIDARTLAAFFQTTWSLTEALNLTVGFRYGRERKQGEQSSKCANRPLCPAAAAFAGQRQFETRSTRDEIERSPKIALSYRLAEDISLFANATRGFKSGGYSGPLLAPRNLEYEPESALSFEAGIKSRWLGDSLMLNATAYRVSFDDLQVNLFDGTNISTINAASAVSQGLEIDLQWLPPLDFLTLAGSLGISDVAYGDFRCGPAQAGSTTSDPACNTSGEANPPPTQDLSGRETPFAPRLSASFTPSVKFPLWPRRQIGGLLGIDVLYQGEQFLDVDLDPASHQAATTRINVRLGIAPLDRRWSLIVNAKNLTGERERAVLIDQPQFPGNYATVALIDEPQYVVELRYNFGD